MLSALEQRGVSGRMLSCTPPITVPAWMCMMSGKDPGELGVYGFRNRRGWDYEKLALFDSTRIRAEFLWDHVAARGGRSVVLNMPGTYPARKMAGGMISCFLTPSQESDWAYPPEWKQRVEKMLDGKPYPFDVEDYRGGDPMRIHQELQKAMHTRFAVAKRLWDEERPDFFLMVEMAIDRIHHAAWQYLDPEHPRHDPSSPLAEAIHDMYVRLDAEIAQFLEGVDESSTQILIVSDHGARRCEGGFCINEWLRREGYLTLREESKDGVVEPRHIDWKRTQAWAEGGYYARIFLNVEGREPQGIVASDDYMRKRGEIQHRLQRLTSPDGKPLRVDCHKPEQIYRRVEGMPPDLLVVLGDYAWRAVARLNPEGLFTQGEGWGLDGANHAPWGYYCLCRPGETDSGTVKDITIRDAAGLLFEEQKARNGNERGTCEEKAVQHSMHEEREAVEQRLRDLGYLG